MNLISYLNEDLFKSLNAKGLPVFGLLWGLKKLDHF